MYLYIYMVNQERINKNMCKNHKNSFKDLAGFHGFMYLKSLHEVWVEKRWILM
jgi:hypothetical protein